MALKVRTASPATGLAMLKDATPSALGVEDGVITMDSLVESTVTGAVRATSEAISITWAARPETKDILDRPCPSTVNAVDLMAFDGTLCEA